MPRPRAHSNQIKLDFQASTANLLDLNSMLDEAQPNKNERAIEARVKLVSDDNQTENYITLSVLLYNFV